MGQTNTRPTLDDLVKQNIEVIAKLEASALQRRTPVDRAVDLIARFCGSMVFVYIHVVFFGAWIIFNLWPGLP